MGRPPLITREEEAALVAHVVWLERSGFPAERAQVEEAAREFRLSRGFPDSPFNKNWYAQFRSRHQELTTSYIKAVDKARKSYENNDIQNTETFFDNLKSTVEELDIGPSEMWNEDETGRTSYWHFDEAAAARYRTWSTMATSGSHQVVPFVDLPRAAASEVLDFAFDMNLHRT
ncbi:hypothetical protein MRS44_017587 [Fusarium solani]|uniref:uncharacterized protein n=1 Tax=Fusarium solani TaxID=169388 RepID=UPI0032C4902E|nr:hypothetical protein MRS44_017587 [Fusarium solani]